MDFVVTWNGVAEKSIDPRDPLEVFYTVQTTSTVNARATIIENTNLKDNQRGHKTVSGNILSGSWKNKRFM